MNPAELFDAMIAALRSRDWRKAASYCDPVSLAAFKQHYVRSYDPDRQEHGHPSMTAEEYMRSDPTMPREAADYFVARDNAHEQSRNVLDHDLPGISTYTQLIDAEPLDVFAAWLRGSSLSHEIDKMVRSGRIKADHADQIVVGGASEFSQRALGYVEDGQLAYVVHRVYDEHQEESEDTPDFTEGEGEILTIAAGNPNVMTARRQKDGDWLLIAGHMFLGAGGHWFGFAPAADEDDVS
jgi:hypothetical protein